MIRLRQDKILLRALESKDLEWLFQVENDEKLWEISNTIQPFSREILRNYIAQAHLDIFTVKQLRLVIEYKRKAVGMIDLFDFEPTHHRAGLGIVILPEFQNKGIAATAIEIIIGYAKEVLQLHQLYANITTDNLKSIRLFEKMGFFNSGTKKDWILSNNTYKDEHIFQLILSND